MNKDREITFEIKEQLGVIAEHPTGWNKELNKVAWNGNLSKYDLRDWDPEHLRMSRGVTLSEEEARALYKLLENEFSEEIKGCEQIREEPASDEMEPEL